MRSHFTVVFLFFTFSLFAQSNFIAETVVLQSIVNQQGFSFNDDVVTVAYVRSPFLSAEVSKVDKNYKIQNMTSMYGAIAAVQDEAGHLYFLEAQDNDVDVFYDPISFSVKKIDRNLEKLFATHIDNLEATPINTLLVGAEINAEGNLVLIPDNKLLVFYRDWRIILDRNSGNVLSVENDANSFFRVANVQLINNTSLLVHADEKIYLYDLEGMLLQETGIDFSSFICKSANVYGIEGDKLKILDANLNPIADVSVGSDLKGINLDASGDIYIFSNTTIYQYDEGAQSVASVYANDYDDFILGAFTMDGQTGLIAAENESIHNSVSHSALAARNTQAILTEQLPDINLTAVELIDQELAYYEVISGIEYAEFYIDLELSLKNTGTVPITDFIAVLHGDCEYPFGNFDFCSKGNIVNQNILPGESMVVPMNNIFLGNQPLSLFGTDYELCFTALAPNQQYDKDYSNNVICDKVTIDVATKELFLPNQLVTIFPNPVGEILQVEVVDNELMFERIEVYSAAGQMVKSENISLGARGNLQVSTESLRSGMYLLQLRSSEGRLLTKRFVKI